MPRVTVRLYGLIPDNFSVQELELESPTTLDALERNIVRLFGDKIPAEYLSAQGLINHHLVIVGDAGGKGVGYDQADISGMKDIWFVVPIAGG